MGKPIPGLSPASRAATEARQRRQHGATGAQVVELARKYTTRAIQKIVDLMDGKAGEVTTLDKEGNVVTVQIEVPATVQAKCAEILLERGYGKSPQAILLRTDSPLGLEDGEKHDLSVEDKIRLLLEQKARGSSEPIDLEASQVGETVVIEENAGSRPPERRVEPIIEEDEVLAGI